MAGWIGFLILKTLGSSTSDSKSSSSSSSSGSAMLFGGVSDEMLISAISMVSGGYVAALCCGMR